MVRRWYQQIADLPLAITLDGEQEHKRRLVNGFSAIRLRGIENKGTVPSSFCSITTTVTSQISFQKKKVT